MNNEYTGAGTLAPPAESKSPPTAPVIAPTSTPEASVQGSPANSEVRAEGPPRSVWREYFESAVVTVIMALFGMTFVVQAVKVPTGSMQNTILIGDHLLVNKFIFAPGPPFFFLPQREIKRGDIVVFKYPGNKEHPESETDPTNTPYKTNYVKRVIGLPGDQIEIRGARVFINNQPLPEQRIAATDSNNDAPLDIQDDASKEEGPYRVYYGPNTMLSPHDDFDRASFGYRYGVGRAAVVPPAHYFVMGDNRDNSSDSRVWGFVPRELVVGRAMFVYWSYDQSAPSSGNFLVDFFKNSRWSRTGTMVK